jgi:hypothetical protein
MQVEGLLDDILKGDAELTFDEAVGDDWVVPNDFWDD